MRVSRNNVVVGNVARKCGRYKASAATRYSPICFVIWGTAGGLSLFLEVNWANAPVLSLFGLFLA